MKTMKALAALLVLVPALCLAEETELQLDRAPIDPIDNESLQRGAHTFVNYCLNCHSANYMRYNRLRDLGLTEQQIRDNLVFTGAKVGDLMKIAMDPKDAKEWFGTPPPDLTVIARSRSSHAGPGSDWLYTYLRTFYRDSSRPTGWNNVVYPNVGMPHALWQLQGEQVLKEAQVPGPGYMKTVHQLALGQAGHAEACRIRPARSRSRELHDVHERACARGSHHDWALRADRDFHPDRACLRAQEGILERRTLRSTLL